MFYDLCWKIESTIYKIKEYIIRQYYIHKKSHYECCVCKDLEAPYFDDIHKYSLTCDMGWHKLKGKPKRWICHHCAEHGFSSEKDKNKFPRENTWDEWQQIVVQPNKKRLLALIKEKDPVYYANNFNNGIPFSNGECLINFELIPKENNND